MLSQERLRKIAWELGTRYPLPHASDYIALVMVHPRLGYIYWQVQEKTVQAIKAIHKEKFNGAYLIARVYDVTDVIFDGLNAHMFFDLAVNGLAGNYYFGIDRLGRDYLAEIGFLFRDGAFHCLCVVLILSIEYDRTRFTTDTLKVLCREFFGP